MPAAGASKPKWDLSLPFTNNRPKLLLVEGPDEWHVVTKVLERLGITTIDARSIEGVTGLRDAIETVQLAGSDFDKHIATLAVLRDAETSFVSARQSVTDALAARNTDKRVGRKLAIPDEPSIFADGQIRVGYYICPNNSSAGCLEDLFLWSLAEDPAMSCVNEYVECLAALKQAGTTQLDTNPSKVKLRAFLASREDATIQPAQAVVAYKWWEHELWKPLIQFLTDL